VGQRGVEVPSDPQPAAIDPQEVGQPARLRHGHQPRNWPAPLGDHDGLAQGNTLEQPIQVCFRGVDVDRLHTKSSLSWPKPNDRALRPNARLSGVPGDIRGLPEIPRPSYGSRFDREERATSEPACHLQDALHGLQRRLTQASRSPRRFVQAPGQRPQDYLVQSVGTVSAARAAPAERGPSSSFGGTTPNLPANVDKRLAPPCIVFIKSGAKPNILLRRERW